ncbi:MAG TPA: nitroreductase family protein [Candidatus Limnocylindria bacterium]|nr:nitroreductase family protein [Candidatus Limnocylindria bacterium]
MEVFDAVRTVLAVRSYRPGPVPGDVVRRIVEAGRLSGSAGNVQPWHFIVVEDRSTLGRLGEIMTTGRYVAGAAFAIVVAVKKDSLYAVSDTSRAIQNMVLTAWAEGIGSNWTGFGPLPAVEQLLGIPETHMALAVLPFGVPDAKLGLGRKKRKPLGKVASRERFGAPFS